MIDRFDDLLVHDRVKKLQGDDLACQRVRGSADDHLEIIVVSVAALVAAFSEDLEVSVGIPVGSR